MDLRSRPLCTKGSDYFNQRTRCGKTPPLQPAHFDTLGALIIGVVDARIATIPKCTFSATQRSTLIVCGHLIELAGQIRKVIVVTKFNGRGTFAFEQLV